jgi:hypothetical protein
LEKDPGLGVPLSIYVDFLLACEVEMMVEMAIGLLYVSFS